MGTAKIVSLTAKPAQSSMLSFEVDGILATLPAQLGTVANAFDFKALYAMLGNFPTQISVNPSGQEHFRLSRLLYDGPTLATYVAGSTLATLRAESRKTTLVKAINTRQNMYFAKYGHIDDVVMATSSAYSSSVPNSKPNRLDQLSKLSNDQSNALGLAYTDNNRTGVVKTTNSSLTSKASSNEIQEQSATSRESTKSNESGQSGGTGGGYPPQTSSSEKGKSHTRASSIGSTKSQGSAIEQETIVNTDYEYRYPFIENQARNERAQISLLDQQFAQFMYGLQLPDLTTVLINELNSIDNDVYNLQIAFLNTLLLPPFAGTITGIYKNPGDAVRAGEPIVRVEDNSSILLTGTVIYRGAITINSDVSVTTSLYGAAGPQTMIAGKVVAVRGHVKADDQRQIVVKCDNTVAGNEVVPISYSFDFDDTVLTIQ